MVDDLKCPECGGRMVSRLNAQTQQRFWGCRTYPTCRGTRNTNGEVPGEGSRAFRRRDDEDTDAGPQGLLPSDRQRAADRRRW